MAWTICLPVFLIFAANLRSLSAQDIFDDFCSVDRLASVFSLEQLAELTEKWSEKRQLTPIVVVKQLEEKFSQSDEKLDGRVSPPVAQPPSFNFPNSPKSVSQPNFSDFPPFRSLAPPANAVVNVADLTSIEVTVSPRMSITEALRQASNKLTDLDGNSYVILWKLYKKRNCFIIKSVGSVNSNSRHKWLVHVTDGHLGRTVWQDICLPSVSEVQIRPGTVVSLTYLPQDRMGPHRN